MNSIKNIKKNAKFLTEYLSNGNTYTTKYVLDRLEKAAFTLSSNDAFYDLLTIAYMASVKTSRRVSGTVYVGTSSD